MFHPFWGSSVWCTEGWCLMTGCFYIHSKWKICGFNRNRWRQARVRALMTEISSQTQCHLYFQILVCGCEVDWGTVKRAEGRGCAHTRSVEKVPSHLHLSTSPRRLYLSCSQWGSGLMSCASRLGSGRLELGSLLYISTRVLCYQSILTHSFAKIIV